VNGVRLPLALSLAGHALLLAALCLLAIAPPPRPAAPALHGIELILAPPQPPPAPRPPPAARPAQPKPAAVRPLPATPKPVAEFPPAHPRFPVVAEPPPRPRRPPAIRQTARPVPRRVLRRLPRFVRPEPVVPRLAPPAREPAPVVMEPPRRPVIPRRSWRYARPEPIMPRYEPPASIPEPAMPRYMPPERWFPATPAPAAPAPVSRPAAPPQAAIVTPGYRALLRDWLEAHKYYPDIARERGEEGLVLLRFRIDRSGRVLDCAVAGSSGHADLDDAAAEMMRGAVLPPFPPSMPEQSIEITVPIRFGLS
jgi:protein TonB